MGTHYNPKIVTDGLDTMLDFANTKSYPGSGTTIYDISGNNNHATSANTPTLDSSNLGSMVFNGSSDYINLANTLTQIDSSYKYTIIIVAKLSSVATARRQLISSDDGGFDWSMGAGDFSKYIIFTGAASVRSTTSQDLGWHIFTAQWTGTNSKLYIDNVLEVNTTIGFDISFSAITSIGRNPVFAGGSEYWAGNVAVMAKYDRVLSEYELSKNFEALRGRFGI